MAADLPERTAGLPIAGRERGAAPAGSESAATVDARRRRAAHGHAAVLAARPHRPGRPRRGGHPAGGLRAIPSTLPPPPPGRGLTERQRLRRSGRPGAGRVRATSRCCRYPFVGAAGLGRSSAWPTTTRAGARCGWPTRSPTTSRCCARRCCRACSRRCAATSAGACATSRCSRPAWSSCPAGAAAAAAVLGVSTGGRPTTSSPRWTPRCPDQPLHVGGRARPATREPPGWWGPGRPATWADAIEAARVVAARRPGRADRPGRPAGALAPGPLRGAAAPATTVVGHAGELHPRVVAALGLPRAHLRDGARPRRARRRRRSVRGAGAVHLPAGAAGRRAGRRRRGAGGRGRGGAAGRRRRRCSSRCGCSTSTPAPSGEGRKCARWRTRCGSGRRTGRSPSRRRRRPATRRSPRPAGAPAPSSAPDPRSRLPAVPDRPACLTGRPGTGPACPGRPRGPGPAAAGEVAAALGSGRRRDPPRTGTSGPAGRGQPDAGRAGVSALRHGRDVGARTGAE